MSVPVIVPKDIAVQGEQQINSGAIQTIKKGVELLLQNNLYIEGALTSAGHGQREVSNLLKKGLTALTNSPHETLGLAIGAKTQEIRKAYKKNALQYHPDKNPLTTPLFQAIHAAHDKLADRELRAKEERMAAASAASVGPKGPTRQSYGGQSSSTSNTSQSTSSSSNNNNNNAYSKPTYEQRRSTFDAKPSAQQQQQSSYYNRDPNPQPSTQQQRQEYPQSSAYARYQEEEQLRKQRYEDFLKEQQKKVESDKRAKEFAARAQAQAAAERAYYEKQQADARKAAADFKQAADIQAEIAAKREEVLRAAAAAAAAGQAYRAGEAQSGKYGGGKQPAPAAAPGAEKDSYRQVPNPNLRSFNTNNAGSSSSSTSGGPANPPPQYYSGGAAGGANGSGGSSNTAYSNAHNASAYSPRYGDVPPSNEAPNSARGPANNSNNAGKVPPINVTENKDAKSEKYKYKYVYPPGVNETNKTAANSGYPSGPDTARSEDSSRHANSTPSNAPPSSKGVVPRPFGLKCTSVTTSVVELEWNTSATYRNMLSVELSWRYLGTAAKHSWESANKLISSGKCRKKNLVSGGQYEFKVRAVEELVGGMLGNRSDWSESIFVTLARESSKDLNSLREDKKVPASVEVPSKPAPTASSTASTTKDSTPTAATSSTSSSSSAGAGVNPTKPAADKIPTSFQRFNPKSDSPITTNPTTTSSSTSSTSNNNTTSPEEVKPHRTQVPPVGSTAVPPPIHRFSTINETSPSSNPTSTTGAPSVPPSRVGSSLGLDGKNVLNSSAREAWGKDSIKIPSTPDKPNHNNHVSGSNNSRTFQVKSANVPAGTAPGNSSSAASASATATPPTAASNNNAGVPPSSSRSSTLPAEYDAEYEVDEDIDYEDDSSRSSGSPNEEVDEEEEEEEEEEQEEEEQRYSDDNEGEEVSEDEEEGSGESEGIAYQQKNDNKKQPQQQQHSQQQQNKKPQYAQESPSLASDSMSPSNQKTHSDSRRPVDSDDDDDAPDSPVLRFKSVNPVLIPPHLRPPLATAAPTNANNGNAAAAGKKEPSVKAAIEAEDDDEEEDHYSDEDDSFDMEEEQYFDLVAPPGGSVGYKHPVRAEPFMKSKLIGHLLMGCTVLAIADCGDWLKVKVHQPTKSASAAAGATGVWGWCLRADQTDGKRHECLHKTSAPQSNNSNNNSQNQSQHLPESKKTASSSTSTTTSAAGSSTNGMSRSGESQSTSALPTLAQQASAATAALKQRLQQQQQRTEESNKQQNSPAQASGNKMGTSASTSKLSSPVPTNHKGSGSSGGSKAASKEKDSPASHITPLHPSSHLFTPTAASVAASINHVGSAAHLKSGGKVSPPVAGSANEKQFHSHKVNNSKAGGGSEGRKAPKNTPSKESSANNGSTPTASGANTSAAAASVGGSNNNTPTTSSSNNAAAGVASPPAASGGVQDAINGENDKHSGPASVTDKLPNLAERKVNSIRLAPLAPNTGSNRSTYNLQVPTHASSFVAAAPPTTEGGVGSKPGSSSTSSNNNGSKSGSGGSSESVVETWIELFDTSGHPYYFNEASGESSWDAPEWIEEKDPSSGHKYYVKASEGNALASTWTKPKKFAKLIRQVEAT